MVSSSASAPRSPAGYDEFYSNLEGTIDSIGAFRATWDRTRLQEVLELVSRLLDREATIWSGIESGSVATFLQLAPRRFFVVRQLSQMRKQCEKCLEGSVQVPRATSSLVVLTEEFLGSLRKLAEESDPFRVEDQFQELITNDRRREGLLAAVIRDSGIRSLLLPRLWECAEEVLLQAPVLFEFLGSLPAGDARFAAVHDLLTHAHSPSEESIRLALGTETDARDMLTAWRCLLVGHREVDVRGSAAEALLPYLAQLDGVVWTMISRASFPPRAALALGQRLLLNRAEATGLARLAPEHTKGEESQRYDVTKLLFDSTRSRIRVAIDGATDEDGDPLTTIGELLGIFLSIDCFVEDDYFERLQDLISAFQSRARRYGHSIGVLDEGLRVLKTARERQRKPRARPPASAVRLPLPVQRHLARESKVYATLFIASPHLPIAREAIKKVDESNIAAILSQGDRIMGTTYKELLDAKVGLITSRTDFLLAALQQIHCTPAFAERHWQKLKKMPRRVLSSELMKTHNKKVGSLLTRRLLPRSSGTTEREA